MDTKILTLSIVWILTCILSVVYVPLGILLLVLWAYTIYFMSINTPDGKKSIGIMILWILGLLGLLVWWVIIKPTAMDWK